MRALRVVATSLLVVSAATLPAACQDVAVGGPEAARRALLAGDYQRATVIYRTLARASDATDEVRHGLIRALRETGGYREAEEAVRRWLPEARGWLVPLGELMWLQGRRDEADSLFRSGLEAGGAVALRSGALLGQLVAERGQHEEARRLWTGVIRMDPGRVDDPEVLLALATAFEGLGRQDPQRFRDALTVYDQAIRAAPDRVDIAVRLGLMFLARFNFPEALKSFDGVLARNPRHAEALLGKALLARAEGRGDPGALLEQALAINPNLVPAHVAVAAGALEREDYEGAEDRAGRALAVNAGSLEALTVVAAGRMMRGDSAGFDAARGRVEAINPGYAEFWADLAELSARNRFYHRAVDLAARGVAVDPQSAAALGALGTNQLRVGRMAEGRTHLERAFALDPFNVWIKNTLDLLDVYDRYGEQRSARFVIRAAPEEVDLLSLYLTELGEEGYDALARRYRHRPATPIQLEVYRHHADFSVRTVGLAGLGALGVSFGTVLAMDSPQARARGEFNWGSTFWHELAHTFTLGVTDHRVPRWLSEGLSVLEERRARPGWGAKATVGFLRAASEDRLLPVSRLNDGFVRPTYPEQVGFSYFQASLVCEMIEETRGPDAINAMLNGYRRGLAPEAVVRAALQMEPAELDREYDRWFRARYGSVIRAVSGREGGEFQRVLREALNLLKTGLDEDARTGFERAKALFPEYHEAESPSWHLAALHRKAGRLEDAARELTHLTGLAESNYEANLELASVLEALGDSAGAAAALERAVFVDPRDVALHQRLAGLYAAVGQWALAVRERRAVVALAPPDLAEAWYQLALAWDRAGNPSEARRAVLQALDRAPAFEAAQDLLLRIRSGVPERMTR